MSLNIRVKYSCPKRSELNEWKLTFELQIIWPFDFKITFMFKSVSVWYRYLNLIIGRKQCIVGG